MEVWRRIPGYPNYEISTHGRVRRKDSHYLLQLRIYKDGYREVALYARGKLHFKRVHRLVALTFLGKPPKGKPLVCHINDVKHDNHLRNLRYGSRKDNARDAIRNGRYRRGETSGRVRATEALVRKIRVEHEAGVALMVLAQRYKLSYGCIQKIVYRVNWKHVD